MYKYETHMHTSPVSKCASASVRDSLVFYKSLGYDGVFITNHFLDGNIGIDNHYFDGDAGAGSTVPYRERIEFYFSDYEKEKLFKDDLEEMYRIYRIEEKGGEPK